jgi:hypothetical protein
MQNTRAKEAETAGDAQHAGDAHVPGVPAKIPNPKIQDGNPERSAQNSNRQNTSRPIQNQKSKIKNHKCSYRKTPAREAAYLTNFKKAQAVPKEKRYQPSGKRYAANLNNLEKARAALRRGRTGFAAATGKHGMPPPDRPPGEASATLRRDGCCYFRLPSAAQVEQAKLRQSLASLFPAYPTSQELNSDPRAAEAGFGTRD